MGYVDDVHTSSDEKEVIKEIACDALLRLGIAEDFLIHQFVILEEDSVAKEFAGKLFDDVVKFKRKVRKDLLECLGE